MHFGYSGEFEPVPVVTLSEFHKFKDVPLVITDLMKTWDSYPVWNFEFFKSNFGNYGLTADKVLNGKTHYVHTTFRQFIDYTLSCNERVPYYAKTSIHLKTDLRNQYTVPHPFKCWYKQYKRQVNEEQKIELSCIYLGPTGAKSPLHIDIWGTSFWNALFQGKKLWFFLTKEQHSLAYQGKVDPFNPDFAKYPDFLKVKPLIHIQQPGELIYCPGNIWHAVYIIEPSIALSENFINEENYEYVIQHFQDYGYLKALNKMKHIVGEHLSA
ncbi:MAG: cupin-like domain-containing protein [Cyclobacteriaceae bacterium]|nr:cupin-like domain-containing protein [Cyclobacteriaceae bacterium]